MPRHTKFIILIILCIAACFSGGSFLILIASVSELLIIFNITRRIAGKSRSAGYITNVILTLLFSFQCLILFFSGEFLSTLMIENIGVADTLGKNLGLYLTAAILTAAISLIPVKRQQTVQTTTKKNIGTLAALVYGISIATGIIVSHNTVSPLSSLCKTAVNLSENRIFRLKLSRTDSKEVMEFFHRDSIRTDFRSYGAVKKKPNIILIFCEGLSAEAIDIYNSLGLGLTPNLNKLHSEALTFDNYFNHTAATFRGLRGQLYSGFQYRGGYGDSEDKGFAEIKPEDIIARTEVKIKSLVNILDENGYNTRFINPEPEHVNTVNYIRSLGFDTIVPENGDNKITDKEGFELLANEISLAEEPFFLCFYNIGTHHGHDSPDKKYGNGKNSILNKYYNYDYQFGKWYEKMKAAGVFENTILVFTTDHASYNAPEWKATFNSRQNSFIAPIPLFIYGDGIKPGRIDAGGRNSLDLTPTILDIIGLGGTSNWFLGSSLFCEPENDYDSYCAIGNDFYHIDDNRVKQIKRRSVKTISEIKRYYTISLNE